MGTIGRDLAPLACGWHVRFFADGHGIRLNRLVIKYNLISNQKIYFRNI
jgi:hypothetical protein